MIATMAVNVLIEGEPRIGWMQTAVVSDQFPVGALGLVGYDAVAALPVDFHELHDGVRCAERVGHQPLTRGDLDRIE